jgi:hypothetical protein
VPEPGQQWGPLENQTGDREKAVELGLELSLGGQLAVQNLYFLVQRRMVVLDKVDIFNMGEKKIRSIANGLEIPLDKMPAGWPRA